MCKLKLQKSMCVLTIEEEEKTIEKKKNNSFMFIPKSRNSLGKKNDKPKNGKKKTFY